MQAKAAGRLPSHGKGARFRQKGTKELHRGKADGGTAAAPNKVFQPGNGELQPCLMLCWCLMVCVAPVWTFTTVCDCAMLMGSAVGIPVM